MAADSLFADVALHVPGNGMPGSEDLFDLSKYNATPSSQVTGVELSDTHAVTGEATSVYCPANTGADNSVVWSGSRFLIPSNTQFSLEMNVYVPAWGSGVHFASFSTSEASGRCLFYATAGGQMRFNHYGAPEYTFGSVPSAAAWHHLCWERDGSNNIVCYVDGAPLTYPVGFSAALGNGGGALRVHYGVEAYLSNIRLLPGARRYAGAFTPPAAPYGALGEVSGQVLNSAGVVAQRMVRAYRRDSGRLVGQGWSDSSGDYVLPVSVASSQECNVICLDDDTAPLANDLILRTYPL